MTNTIRLPLQHFQAGLAAARGDADDRTATMAWYTGATVLQFSFENGLHNLKLSTEPAHVRLGRFNSGTAPFTRGHRSANDVDAVIGVVEAGSARLENGRGVAVVRFSKRPDVEPLYRDVQDGILSNVSVEARLHKLKEITKDGDSLKTFLATDWEPNAVALVAIGADPGAHISAAEPELAECQIEFSAVGVSTPQGLNMQKNTQNGSADRAAEITKRGAKHGCAELAAQHVESGSTVEAFNDALLAAIAAREEQTPTRSHVASITRDQCEGQVEAMSESLACRFTGKAPGDRAKQYMGARLVDLARDLVIASGQRVPYSPTEIIRLAHGTSDFPNLLTGTGNRIMLTGYEAAQAPIKQLARIGTVPDFRTKNVIQLSQMPTLELVPESGEITHGTRAEAVETYRAYTYGRMFSLTRQAIVNDDLGAFADFFRAFGQSAAQLEARLLAGLLTANAGRGATMTDTTALFTEAHGNLIVSGTAMSVDNLGVMRKTLRLQTGLDGSTLLDITPKFLVTSATKETLGEQVLATIAAATVDEANPFSGKLTQIVVPQLDASYSLQWYCFGSPEAAPVLELSYLEGAQGPKIESRPGWDILGSEYRCYTDIGVGAVNHRGAVMNVGA